MLAIGSIIYLKKGSRKLMILNRGPITILNEKEVLFDYSVCLYPLGLVMDKIYYFNEENIDKVVHQGYNDEEEERFQEIYTKWLEENKDKIKKGDVKKEQNEKINQM